MAATEPGPLLFRRKQRATSRQVPALHAFGASPLKRPRLRRADGGVAEWLKAHAWKVCIRATVSRVRIPLPPPAISTNILTSKRFSALDAGVPQQVSQH